MVIKRGDEVVPNPDPVWELQSGDILLLLGSAEQLTIASKLFGA
jgi:CPA2 family monovalent cation:H+ antiporter-2